MNKDLSTTEKLIKLEQLDIVKEYLKFDSLPYPQKQFIWNEWNEYYKEVKQSMTYALYQEIREAYRKNDMPRFKDLLDQMKQMKINGVIPSIPMPKGIDPMTFYHDQTVLVYKRLRSDAQNKNSLEF